MADVEKIRQEIHILNRMIEKLEQHKEELFEKIDELEQLV